MKYTYDIVGMHCESCVRKVTTALDSVDGVTSARVSLNPPQAQVEMGVHVPTETLNRALKTAGDYRLADGQAESIPTSAVAAKESLYPLFLIVAYIIGTVVIVAIATGERVPHVLMRYFMSGFSWCSHFSNCSTFAASRTHIALTMS